jgi:hypothetical protein
MLDDEPSIFNGPEAGDQQSAEDSVEEDVFAHAEILQPPAGGRLAVER